MAAMECYTLDVFTTKPFSGNQLGVVVIPKSNALTQSQKHRLTIEFNYSETIFISNDDESKPLEYTVGIFTIQGELPFAGHPTIGAGWHLMKRHPNASELVLHIKAGDVLVRREGDGVRLKVPSDFKTHPNYENPGIKARQPALGPEDYVDGASAGIPVASIVKGMTFYLLEVTSLDALGRFNVSAGDVTIPDGHLGEWKGFCGLYVFYRCEDESIRVRMFEGKFEDPATGSAASTLCGWLAEQKGDGKWAFDLVQGVEMGRRSEIKVFVDVEGGKVKNIKLAGTAVQVLEGKIQVPEL
ncbi:Diaminopimelate epimerase-like protein [Cylindrobasidium torrendii FP15055 ss-10]|uniref:Diaminopimelate epimerase-like protein n=1 Tax=Cylindrobasidium torrendii FP15055 ss-10 TaxID=1314674 RepID=A0A0D7B831_9AGAR|nr:Diaminopimelate epimerase-like protein [Cylindrobasidium torrendii FP15055 ss-10]